MPIPVKCPNCAKQMQAPDNAAGKKVRCPGCNTVTTAPTPEVVAPAPTETAVSEEVPQPQKEADEEYGIDEGDAEERREIKTKRKRDDEEERRARKRRKPRLEPHHGSLILILAGASVATCWFPIACWVLALYTERLASDDILKMDSGHMDRSGYNLAQMGRIGAYVSALLGLFGCVILGYLVTNWVL